MSLRAYSEINFHITWHVADNNPVLTDEVETQVHRFLCGQAFKTPGVYLHEVGGTDDHIHLVVSTPPTLLISEWIGKLKGGCSYFINHEIANRKVLHWQSLYGVVVFGTDHLPWVKAYVKNQRKHHAEGKTFDRLERTEIEEDDDGPGEEEAP